MSQHVGHTQPVGHSVEQVMLLTDVVHRYVDGVYVVGILSFCLSLNKPNLMALRVG